MKLQLRFYKSGPPFWSAHWSWRIVDGDGEVVESAPVGAMYPGERDAMAAGSIALRNIQADHPDGWYDASEVD